MREIRFRGKRIDNGEWAYGYLVVDESGENNIVDNIGESYFWNEVDPESVGQYIGKNDKNGKGEYEGDIVTWFLNGRTITAPVYYDEDQATFWMGKDAQNEMGLVLNDWMRGEYEVIGNIHEHPHLLEKESTR